MGLQDQIPLSPLSRALTHHSLFSPSHKTQMRAKRPPKSCIKDPQQTPHQPIKTWHIIKNISVGTLLDPSSPPARPVQPQKKTPPATAPRPRPADPEIPRLDPSSPPAGPVQQPPEQKNDRSLSGPAHQLVRTTAEKNDRFWQKQLNTSKLKLRLRETQKWLETITKHI